MWSRDDQMNKPSGHDMKSGKYFCSYFSSLLHLGKSLMVSGGYPMPLCLNIRVRNGERGSSSLDIMENLMVIGVPFVLRPEAESWADKLK